MDHVAQPKATKEFHWQLFRFRILGQSAAHPCCTVVAIGGRRLLSPIRKEILDHEPHSRDDLSHLATCKTLEEDPPILSFGDRQTILAVVMAWALCGPSMTNVSHLIEMS
jgi:hypothetical protein